MHVKGGTLSASYSTIFFNFYIVEVLQKITVIPVACLNNDIINTPSGKTISSLHDIFVSDQINIVTARPQKFTKQSN